MHSKKNNPLLLWWVTPKLPEVHLSDKTGFVKKYFLHPIKRRVAKFYLYLLQKTTDIKVIAITGSAGKTTTKEMLASVLKESGKTSFSKENIDPVYNIPTTILKTVPGTKYIILEMGVEYPGEMDFYLWLASPDVAIITNIFPTHTLFFGDIEGVFEEKSKLAYGISPKGTVVLNSGDAKLKTLSGKLQAKIVWFKEDADPFIRNSNAVTACAKVLRISDAEIKSGLTNYKNPPHRLELIKLKSGAEILDDSYNSNPWAALSTLKYFNKIAKGKKIAVLGDMLELGSYDEQGHRELGREVAASKFDLVIGVGKSSAFLIDEVKKFSKSKTILVDSSPKVTPILEKLLAPGTWVLVKGSRSIGLDKVISELS